MRLRNRMVKATFWTSGDLCRWHRDKREFYRSLWACAEDSCCLEDDMFGVKLTAWPSPTDADLTVEMFEQWRDEMLSEGKLIAYENGGHRYLYIPSMARHEKPRNPQSPDLPLPKWVTWTPAGEGSKGRYEHRSDLLESSTGSVQRLYSGTTEPPALSCPVQSSPVQSRAGTRAGALPPCLSEQVDGVSWASVDGGSHATAAQAFWSAVENARQGVVSTADHGLFASIVSETCPTSCDATPERIDACLGVLEKAAAKTKGKPTALFRRICEEDR